MLAAALACNGHESGNPETIVLALPRGGVPVASIVAQRLQVPLDIMLVRKIGMPGFEEFAVGAIAGGGVCVLQAEAENFGVGSQEIQQTVQRERTELERRELLYRAGRPAPVLNGKSVILVDDGLATGSTMRAAIEATRRQHPARIVVAVPVGASDTCRELDAMVDEIVCLITPEPFRAVGLWYEDFSQTSDEEVIGLLEAAGKPAVPTSEGTKTS